MSRRKMISFVILIAYCVPYVFLGNLLSLLISCLLTQLFVGDDWNYFFKAFPATIRTVQFSGIMLAVQAIPWGFAKVTE